MADVGHQDRGQRVAVGVGVIGQDARGGHGQGRVLGGRVAVRHRDRGGVGGGDRQADRDRVGVEGPVVGLVGEAVGADVAGRRDVADRAVGAQGQAAVADVGHQDRGQGVAVGVGVVGQDARGGDHEGRVLGRGVRVGHRDRGGIGGGHGQADGGGVRVDRPVVGLVGEAVGTDIAGRRDVADRAVGAQGEGAVADVGHQDRAQGVAVGIGVVAEDARGGDRQGRVLGGRVGVGHGDRGGVGGGHRQADRDGVGVEGPVVGLVGEGVGTDIGGGRDVADRAVGAQGQAAVADVGHQDRGQRVAVGVGVIGQDARGGDDQGRVLGRGVAVRRPRPGRRWSA